MDQIRQYIDKNLIKVLIPTFSTAPLPAGPSEDTRIRLIP